MGGGGRGANNFLRSPYWPQSFLKLPKCFKMRVLTVEVLHHQYSNGPPNGGPFSFISTSASCRRYVGYFRQCMIISGVPATLSDTLMN